MKNEKTEKIKTKKVKKAWIKWVLIGLFVLALGMGAKIIKAQKVTADKKYVMQRQRELMIESWKEEGLTEEEIKERMDNMGERRMDGEGSKPEGGMDVMRMGRMMR